MKKVSVELDNELMSRLSEASSSSGVAPETIIADAVARYIYHQGWHQGMLQASIERLERGDVASSEEVASLFEQWTIPFEPNPDVVWSSLALRAFGKDLEKARATMPESASKLARQVWLTINSPDAASRAFPGLTAGTAELSVEGFPFCVVFRSGASGAGIQIVAVLATA